MNLAIRACMGKVEFHRVSLKFHPTYVTHALKHTIFILLYNIDILRTPGFKSSCAFLKRSPEQTLLLVTNIHRYFSMHFLAISQTKHDDDHWRIRASSLKQYCVIGWHCVNVVNAIYECIHTWGIFCWRSSICNSNPTENSSRYNSILVLSDRYKCFCTWQDTAAVVTRPLKNMDNKTKIPSKKH